MRVLRFFGQAAVSGLSALGASFAILEVWAAGTWYLPGLAVGFTVTFLIARPRAARREALRGGLAATAAVVAVLGGPSLELLVMTMGAGIVITIMAAALGAAIHGSPHGVNTSSRCELHFRTSPGGSQVKH